MSAEISSRTPKEGDRYHCIGPHVRFTNRGTGPRALGGPRTDTIYQLPQIIWVVRFCWRIRWASPMKLPDAALGACRSPARAMG